MRQLAAATLALALALPASAHEDHAPDVSDPISLRMTAMTQVGKGIGTLVRMARGEEPFSAPLAEMSLRAMLAAGAGYGALFPEGTEQGHGTEAAPAIWSDRAGFEAELAEYLAVLDAQLESPPAAQADLGATLGAVGATCRSGHEGYRVERN